MSLKAIQLQLKAATIIADNIVSENKKNIEAAIPEMIKANHDQLDRGKLNTDSDIKPFYSDPYAKFKGFDIPDLKLTGAFRNDWDVVLNDKELLFGSNNEKAGFLSGRYSEDIYGLNAANADKIFLKINTKRNNYVKRITKRYY